MKLASPTVFDGQAIPTQHVFCVPDPEAHVSLGPNRSPAFSWRDLPSGTQSLVLLCHDPDVPSLPDDVNQEGREVPDSLPRVDFYHWVLVDIDPARGGIVEAEFADGVVARGKPGPSAPMGTRQGINDYTGWFEGDQDMGGTYYGYDGPCPPWNDSIIHRYHFTLYALSVKRCPVEGQFRGAEISAAIAPHQIGSARLTCTYTLNPRLMQSSQ